jgi:hypothetical protein
VSVISAVSLLRFQPINEIESKSFTNDVSYSSQNVISFSLYGNEDRYTEGGAANAILAQDIYPEWQVRIYHDNSVPENLLAHLASMSNVMLVNMSSSPPSSNPMTWRFLVALDPDVSAYVIRDIDSRLSEFSSRLNDCCHLPLTFPPPYQIFGRRQRSLSGLKNRMRPFT